MGSRLVTTSSFFVFRLEGWPPILLLTRPGVVQFLNPHTLFFAPRSRWCERALPAHTVAGATAPARGCVVAAWRGLGGGHHLSLARQREHTPHHMRIMLITHTLEHNPMRPARSLCFNVLRRREMPLWPSGNTQGSGGNPPRPLASEPASSYHLCLLRTLCGDCGGCGYPGGLLLADRIPILDNLTPPPHNDR